RGAAALTQPRRSPTGADPGTTGQPVGRRVDRVTQPDGGGSRRLLLLVRSGTQRGGSPLSRCYRGKTGLSRAGAGHPDAQGDPGTGGGDRMHRHRGSDWCQGGGRNRGLVRRSRSDEESSEDPLLVLRGGDGDLYLPLLVSIPDVDLGAELVAQTLLQLDDL